MATRLWIPTDLTAQRGQEVCVPINVANLDPNEGNDDWDNKNYGGLGSFNIQLHVDPSFLEYVRAEPGDRLDPANWNPGVISNSPGRLLVTSNAWGMQPAAEVANGLSIVKLYFIVPGDAPPGPTRVAIVADDGSGGYPTAVFDSEYQSYTLLQGEECNGVVAII